jgi:hypothetical protein
VDLVQLVERLERLPADTLEEYVQAADELVAPVKSASLSWTEALKTLSGFVVLEAWENGDARHHHVVLRRSVALGARSLSVVLELTSLRCRDVGTLARVGLARVALVDRASRPLESLASSSLYPRGSVVDLVLGAEDFRSRASGFTELQSVSVSFEPSSDRWWPTPRAAHRVAVALTDGPRRSGSVSYFVDLVPFPDTSPVRFAGGNSWSSNPT